MLYIFSTEVKNGRGGISTALIGYTQALESLQVEYKLVSTHNSQSKISCFINALISISKVKRGDICWFHVGPWFSMLRKLFLITVCKLKGADTVIHFHSIKTNHYLEHPIAKFLVRGLCKMVDHVVVLTPWWQKKFIKNNITASLVVSPNPLDDQLLDVIEQAKNRIGKYQKKNKIVNILSMSRLEPGKGFEAVIESLKLLPDNYHLQIAGTGSIELQLKSQVQLLKLNDRITFLGWLNYESKMAVLQNADVFCLPSSFDSFGMVYLEALSANIPVVGLNKQATPDIVPEQFGVLCDTLSPEELSNAIEFALKLDCSEAHTYLLKKYHPIGVTKQLLKRISNRG